MEKAELLLLLLLLLLLADEKGEMMRAKRSAHHSINSKQNISSSSLSIRSHHQSHNSQHGDLIRQPQSNLGMNWQMK